MLPIIYVILMTKRLVLTLAFRPLFRAIKGDLVRARGGLRGAWWRFVHPAALFSHQAVSSPLVTQSNRIQPPSRPSPTPPS
jgi:hypothetical protein